LETHPALHRADTFRFDDVESAQNQIAEADPWLALAQDLTPDLCG
jgi:hypothetical protein